MICNLSIDKLQFVQAIYAKPTTDALLMDDVWDKTRCSFCRLANCLNKLIALVDVDREASDCKSYLIFITDTLRNTERQTSRKKDTRAFNTVLLVYLKVRLPCNLHV